MSPVLRLDTHSCCGGVVIVAVVVDNIPSGPWICMDSRIRFARIVRVCSCVSKGLDVALCYVGEHSCEWGSGQASL